ncbi:MAG TPA: hypothetical protein VGG25_00435 [Streptosporangiaceae bacterium]|jgi:hypothetical protein
MMRIRTGLGLVTCCCAALAACTASAPQGPLVSVSAPAVGRPQPPSSAQAALSRAAFTPYAALGLSANDGLAPDESIFSLGTACMAAAGYPGTGPGIVPIGLRQDSLAFAQPWGSWGYLGTVQAQQSGFRIQPGSALSALDVDFQQVDLTALPQAEQTAALKCGTILGDFTSSSQSGSLGGITALGNDLATDLLKNPAIQRATRAWSACMTKNGYSLGQPQLVFFQELRAMYGGRTQITGSDNISAPADQAQLAVAAADASCTDSADLAGIYFAVQASYEQQLVSANQQALTAAVRRYRVAYKKELGRLAGLLRTARAMPFTSPKAKG